MPVIYIINGILISIYGFDHNPPHLHARYGEYDFTITLADRIVTGQVPSHIIKPINDFIDSHVNELYELWEKAQRGEKINKIKR